MSQIPTLVAYMEWEMDPKAKSSGTSGPVLDQALIRSVSERTLAAYSQAGAEGADETRLQLKDGEAAIWQRYINWLRPTDNEAAADVALRATRACPQSPSLWSTLLLEMVRYRPLCWLTIRNASSARMVTWQLRLNVPKTSAPCLPKARRPASMCL
jgi:hypothetical protein